jgi:cytochrome c553
MRNPTVRVLLATATVLCTGAAFAGTPTETCDDCHGKGGVSTHADVPTIAGISAFALEEQLGQYKAKERPCAKVKFVAGKHPADAKDDMCTISGKLSDEQIAALAAHYAAQKFVPFKQAADPAKAAVGAKVHKDACDKCHTEGGSVAEDDASLLAGQPKGYLALALKELRSGEREMDKKMAPKIKALTDAETEALIEFYAKGGK